MRLDCVRKISQLLAKSSAKKHKADHSGIQSAQLFDWSLQGAPTSTVILHHPRAYAVLLTYHSRTEASLEKGGCRPGAGVYRGGVAVRGGVLHSQGLCPGVDLSARECRQLGTHHMYGMFPYCPRT